MLCLVINSLVMIHSKTYSLYNSSVLIATSNAKFPWFTLPTWQYTRTLIPVRWCKITLSRTSVRTSVRLQGDVRLHYQKKKIHNEHSVFFFTIRCKMLDIIKQTNYNCHQICRHDGWFLIQNCLQIPIHFFFNNWHVGKSY